jgi:hypothetical protein
VATAIPFGPHDRCANAGTMVSLFVHVLRSSGES